MKKNPTRKILNWSLTALAMLAVVFLIAFVTNAENTKRCQGISIKLVGSDDTNYISKEDIENHITHNGMKPLVGKYLSQVNLSDIEAEVLKIEQIQSCEVSGDLQGNINIIAKPYLPYARIINTRGHDSYMDDKGKFFPLSKYHSERVLLISGAYVDGKKGFDPVKDSELIKLIHTIKKNNFWNSQITRLDISQNRLIEIVPLMGNQNIVFGDVSNVESKLKKMMVFYEKILPTKGWENFETIDVQFKNQIVCK